MFVSNPILIKHVLVGFSVGALCAWWWRV